MSVGFVGVVLCGGESRRMGRDKAFVPVDGVPMCQRAGAALRRAGADDVLTVGGDVARLKTLGLDARPDEWPGQGPLGGIITALTAVGPDTVAVVLSCDLLDPDDAAIAAVVRRRAETDADLALPVVGGRRQWLHGAWHGRCAAILSDVFGAGARSVAAGAAGLRITTMCEVAASAVADADTPEQLEGRDQIRS